MKLTTGCLRGTNEKGFCKQKRQGNRTEEGSEVSQNTSCKDSLDEIRGTHIIVVT